MNMADEDSDDDSASEKTNRKEQDDIQSSPGPVFAQDDLFGTANKLMVPDGNQSATKD
jgi:hypothetical protein